MSEERRYIPTLSVLVNGILNELVESGEIKGEIIIPWEIISVLEELTEKGEVRGDRGLRELKKLKKLSEERNLKIKFIHSGNLDYDGERFDSLIRRVAYRENAIIVTDKKRHVKISEAMGIKTLLCEKKKYKKLLIEKYFNSNTMSIHLKEGVCPYAKEGLPGEWKFTPISEKPVTREEMEKIIEEIRDLAEEGECMIEISKKELLIVQLRDYRIVITWPPLSDGLEITAVKPVAKLSLEDYGLPIELIDRLEKRAEGILIAGAPGEGKSTFAQALAEFYRNKGKVVKTIEAPRDLQLPEDITQYSKSIASSKEIHDILLLSRPDYTIFDEMRNSEDFEL